MRYTGSIKFVVLFTVLFVTSIILSGCGGTAPPINHSPTIYNLIANPSSIEVNQDTTITCYATDPDGDTLTYTWTNTGGTITGSGSTITWTAPSTAGTYTITCTVSDGELIGIQAISIVVTEPEPENQAPVITSTAVTSATVGEAYTYPVIAIDANDDDLTYSLIPLTDFVPAGMNINAGTGVISWIPTAVGSFEVTVEVSDGELSDTQSFIITVTTSSVNIVYRALCVGVGDYLYFPDACGNTDLPAPPYDVDKMRQTLGYCKFGLTNAEFSTISYLKDGQATKSNILQSISSTFSEADSNDISYFYFSGHGMRYEDKSYLCPADITCYSPLNSYISVDELETALSAIPGTKVVFLDSCHSGGFIGKGKEEENKISLEELIDFNKDVIDIFSLGESRGLLTTNKYKVLTSCHYDQVCYEIYPVEGDPYGVFTMALCDGCGYSGDYPADINLDTKVSLQEAYLYIIDWVYSSGIDQDVQIYHNNSTFTIAEY